MRWRRALLVVLGVAALLGVIRFVSADAVGRAITHVGAQGFAIVALVHLPVLALLGTAWWLISDNTSVATLWKFIGARIVREAVAEVLPFSQLGGVLAGGRALTLGGLAAAPTAISIAVDLIIEQVAKLPYVLAGTILLLWIKPNSSLLRPFALGIGLGLIAASVAFLYRQRIFAALKRAVVGLVGRWQTDGAPDKKKAALDHILVQNRRLLTAFVIHMLTWTLGGAETWIVFHMMGVAITGLQAFIIDSLFSGLRTFGFAIPAAIGVQEVGYVLVGALFGLSPAFALAFSLIRRGREFAIGIPALGIWQFVEGKRAIFGFRDGAYGEAENAMTSAEET